jgi:hypothetical protein
MLKARHSWAIATAVQPGRRRHRASTCHAAYLHLRCSSRAPPPAHHCACEPRGRQSGARLPHTGLLASALAAHKQLPPRRRPSSCASTGLNRRERAPARPHRHGRRVQHPAQAHRRVAQSSLRLRSLAHPPQAAPHARDLLRSTAASPRGSAHSSAGSGHQNAESATWSCRHHHSRRGSPWPARMFPRPETAVCSQIRARCPAAAVLEAYAGFRLPLRGGEGAGEEDGGGGGSIFSRRPSCRSGDDAGAESPLTINQGCNGSDEAHVE